MNGLYQRSVIPNKPYQAFGHNLQKSKRRSQEENNISKNVIKKVCGVNTTKRFKKIPKTIRSQGEVIEQKTITKSELRVIASKMNISYVHFLERAKQIGVVLHE